MFQTFIVVVILGLIQDGLCFERSYVTGITKEQAITTAKRVLTQYPLVDGHNDLPHQYRSKVQNQMEDVDLTQDVNEQWGYSHTDIPRLREGQLGAQFWAAYISCSKQYSDAVRAGLEQVDVIHRMIDLYPDDFQWVTSADGIEEAFQAGKIGGLIGMEGGHMIDSSASALRMFYDLGVRYLSPTHSCTTPWADNSYEDDKGEDNPLMGLSPWGEDLIVEMNRLGMLVDLSHVAKQTMLDALSVSLAPVIFSHSSVYAICNHNRNIQDDVLYMLQENGGLAMITFVPSFLNCFPTEQEETDIPLLADHIEYVRNLIGVDYVGIGGDYDGTGRLPIGMEDVSKYPALFAELVMRGWSDDDLEKLAGRNLVRVFREVEQVRDNMAAAGEKPLYDWIPEEDLPEDLSCRTSN
ncbi:hypothetical protein CAPTEDRAFT_215136 [Capitella teleta]|uniref:Dipeptidase n=1 Tax=Capitella teleta TaxID=283909 RepID=R7THQ0_CAPTE|nr:hypothetical protein CAPTEDRAFT_215136 [Capitella teleta]|eukprot:ELT93254.1 hypothetical protein CAPTEDRAFT_215136 [Capitella teleta]